MHTKYLLWISILLLFANSSSAQVFINEINYRSPDQQSNIEFVELINVSQSVVDISAWTLTDGIEYTFPPNTLISANSSIVVVADQAAFSSTFSQVNGVIYSNFTGKLSNSGDDIILLDADCIEVDKVDYKSWQEWPNVRYSNNGDSPISIQKINPLLPGQHGGSWASGVPSPGDINTSVLVQNSSNVCLLYTSPSPRDATLSRMPSSA